MASVSDRAVTAGADARRAVGRADLLRASLGGVLEEGLAAGDVDRFWCEGARVNQHGTV
jgi:hypothetical protein